MFTPPGPTRIPSLCPEGVEKLFPLRSRVLLVLVLTCLFLYLYIRLPEEHTERDRR